MQHTCAFFSPLIRRLAAICRIGGVSDVRGSRRRRKNKGMKRNVEQTNRRGEGPKASIDRCTARILDRLDWAFMAASIDTASRTATTGLHLRDVRVSF